MAEITASLVKELRERTGAGMMECKSALVEAKGDLPEAEVVLRKRGIASAGKKSSRATKQGLIGSYIQDGAQLGVLVEVNCESDFVARTDDFQELVQDIAVHVAQADPKAIRKEEIVNEALADQALLEQPFFKEAALTVGQLVKTKIAKLGENISIARFVRAQVTGQGAVGSYIHHGGQLGVLVEINCESAGAAQSADFQELVHDVAMHVAAADPRFVRKEDVTEDVLAKEREIQKARVIAEGKPEKMADKIVEGRMQKFYEEVCLIEQPFVKEPALTVGQLVKTKGAKLGENITVTRFIRFKVGDSQAADTTAETPAA
jgi:elongation factor Ts